MWKGGWQRGANTAQGPAPRSRGEALVRLSIPNVLRCLEFFFPDRRYLCRAARGALFAGRKATVPQLPGGGGRPGLRFVHVTRWSQGMYLTLPRFLWIYFDRHRKRKGGGGEDVPC